MHSYKLTYFNTTGRAEQIQIIFALAEVPFEDIRVPYDDWPAYKPKTPLGTLPVLAVDGVEIGQSFAILRYLALEIGLDGPSNLTAAIADSLADQMSDFATEMFAWQGATCGFLTGDKEELYRTVFLPARDKHFPYFEQALSNMLLRLVPEPGQLLAEFPLIAAHQKEFLALPKVADHIANRPKDLWF